MPPAPDPLDVTTAPAARRPPVVEETIGPRDLREWRTRAGRVAVEAFAGVVRLGRRLWGRWALPLTLAFTLLVGGALAAVVATGAGEVYEGVEHHSGLAGLDQPVLDWAVSTRTPARSQWLTDYTDIGGPVGGAVLAALVLGVLVWAWRRWTPVAVLLPGLAGALLITVVGKDLTGRARPPHELAVPPYEASASFPSGHTLNATVLAGLTAYLLLIATRRMWLGVLGVLAAAAYAGSMGLSRVWLGHHWLTDVVAGWLLGLAWVIGVVTLHRLWLTLRSRTDADPPPRPLSSPGAPPGHHPVE